MSRQAVTRKLAAACDERGRITGMIGALPASMQTFSEERVRVDGYTCGRVLITFIGRRPVRVGNGKRMIRDWQWISPEALAWVERADG